MIKIMYGEYDAFAASLDGPAGAIFHDADYDRGIVWPDGIACEINVFNDLLLNGHLKMRFHSAEEINWLVRILERANDLNKLFNKEN